MRRLANPKLDRVFATNAGITYINRRWECFLAHDERLHLVGKGPGIGMPKYRFGTLSNCFLSGQRGAPEGPVVEAATAVLLKCGT